MKTALAITLCLSPFATAQTSWRQANGPKANWIAANPLAGGVLLSSRTNSTVQPGQKIAAITRDGAVWGEVAYPDFSFSAHGGGMIIFVNNNASGRNFAYRITPDSYMRLDFAQPSGFSATSICYGNGTWLITGSNAVLRSEDTGFSWAPVSIPAEEFTSVDFGGGEFVASGGGKTYASQDGKAWSVRSREAPFSLIRYWKGAWYQGDYISQDGAATWEYEDGSPYSLDWWKGGDVAIRLSGSSIYTSTDFTRWTYRESNVSFDLSTVAFSGKFYVAAGPSGVILVSNADTAEPPKPPSLSASPAIELSFPTQFGVVYQLQSSPDNATWTNDGATLTGSGETLKLYRPAASARRFWRIRAR